MHLSKAFFPLFLIALVAVSTVATHSSDDSDGHHKGCGHHLAEFYSDVLEAEEGEFITAEGRLLRERTPNTTDTADPIRANTTNTTDPTNTTDTNTTNTTTTKQYPNIRLYPFFDYLKSGTESWKNYVKNELFPPVISYFQAALKIKYPMGKWTAGSTKTTLCGLTTPTILKTTGVETDTFIFVTSTTDTTGSWVASASSCLTSGGSGRPLVMKILLNTNTISVHNINSSNPMVHEYNMYLVMHEIIHGLGFTVNFFYNYRDADGNALKNHIKTVSLAGYSRTVVDLKPLTERLRNFYGCPTLPGAFMENNGGGGTAKSHWERRFFAFDTMSSGAFHGQRVSEFTLAFLEGTGWYVPDYSYAEPFFYGKGKGCDFIYGTCDANKYNEYCTGNSREVTKIGRGGGFCKSDSCSDGCRFVIPQKEYDCENPAGTYYTTFASKQAYGRTTGSRGFMGNLTSLSKTVSNSTYCFKFNCVTTGSGDSTVTKLEVMFGTAKLLCAKKGPLKVSGYNGFLLCPDPAEYCSTVATPYCRRNCMGRGKCVDGNKCVCDPGFGGVDCGFTAS